MDNVVDRTIEIPFMQLKLFVHSFCPSSSLFVSARSQKKTSCTISVSDRENFRKGQQKLKGNPRVSE